MPRFVKRPIVIEAMQFNEANAPDIVEWGQRSVTLVEGRTSDKEWLEIFTLEGVMTANYGDWIIKGINDEFYPCKDDVFKKTYDPV